LLFNIILRTLQQILQHFFGLVVGMSFVKSLHDFHGGGYPDSFSEVNPCVYSQT